MIMKETMKKKTYVAPEVEIGRIVHTQAMLAGSIDSNVGIRGGGIDTGGMLDPEAKGWTGSLSFDIWEDESE